MAKATEELDVVVIGGGIIGMATARALSQRGREVVLLEAETAFGAHTSSRNSEVIHAGIYYPTDSLKARLCVLGKQALYGYCAEHGVAHRRIGKLIVANSQEQVKTLEDIKAQAEGNGVHDLEWLDHGQIRGLEPEVTAEVGLFSPSTGIVDSHELLTHFRRDAEEAGAVAVAASPVQGGRATNGGILLSVGGEEPFQVHCRAVVNAAGLFAQRVALSIVGMPSELIPPSYFAKGHYFTLSGRSPFSHLVYPVPEPGGLGIHVTLDMSGAARFGPDVSWVDGVDYTFDESRSTAFYAAIGSYYPKLGEGELVPGYTGIRPKLAPKGSPPADFVVQGPEHHGLPVVNLFGIESPGLTASLALADMVATTLAP